MQCSGYKFIKCIKAPSAIAKVETWRETSMGRSVIRVSPFIMIWNSRKVVCIVGACMLSRNMRILPGWSGLKSVQSARSVSSRTLGNDLEDLDGTETSDDSKSTTC